MAFDFSDTFYYRGGRGVEVPPLDERKNEIEKRATKKEWGREPHYPLCVDCFYRRLRRVLVPTFFRRRSWVKALW